MTWAAIVPDAAIVCTWGCVKNRSKRRPLILKFGLDEVVGGVPGLFGGVGGSVGVLPALLLTLRRRRRRCSR